MDEEKELNLLTGKIIGAAIEVHNYFGPGLLESTYEECLCHELEFRGISFERQKSIPLLYKGKELNCGYRMDIIVENKVIVELKSVDSFSPIHGVQLLTYLRLTNNKVGLLINFNVSVLKNGLKRIVNNL